MEGYFHVIADLGPAQVGPAALAYSPLGHEVQDSATPLCIAGVPVLDRGIFHVGILLHNDLHNCCMELVLIPHRSGTTFHVTQRRSFVSNDQGPFELASTGRVDPEIAG